MYKCNLYATILVGLLIVHSARIMRQSGDLHIRKWACNLPKGKQETRSAVSHDSWAAPKDSSPHGVASSLRLAGKGTRNELKITTTPASERRKHSVSLEVSDKIRTI